MAANMYRVGGRLLQSVFLILRRLLSCISHFSVHANNFLKTLDVQTKTLKPISN